MKSFELSRRNWNSEHAKKKKRKNNTSGWFEHDFDTKNKIKCYARTYLGGGLHTTPNNPFWAECTLHTPDCRARSSFEGARLLLHENGLLPNVRSTSELLAFVGKWQHAPVCYWHPSTLLRVGAPNFDRLTVAVLYMSKGLGTTSTKLEPGGGLEKEK